ncbi:MAG: hypothetical protein ACFFE6_13145 [Candidatus Thorarchaeota archaeon]
MQSVSSLLNTIYMYMAVGFLLAVILLLLFSRSKVASSATKTYVIGSILSFLVGSSGYYSIYFIVIITWGNVLGLIGGYLCIILAIVQYFFDRRKHSVLNV